MRKVKKTYGVKGFMEYHAVINVGKSRMKVPFTNGSMSAMGVNPATFTTDVLMVQHAIENSAEYGRGLIYLVSAIDLGSEVKIEGAGNDGAQAPVAEVGGEAAVAEAPEAGTKSNVEVEFASNDEAKDYLELNFGLVRSKLRNREDICAAGRSHGVEIHFV